MAAEDRTGEEGGPLAARLFRRAALIRPGEGRAVALSSLYFFCLLASYFVLRPLREEMGLAGGVRNLKYLWTGTLLGTLALTPVFAWLVSRFPRRRFVPVVYRFFGLNLLGFWAALRWSDPESSVWIARAFYVWLSVFNMFAVSVFWGFCADTFRTEQSHRLFGVIGVGGTIGAMAGSWFTAWFTGSGPGGWGLEALTVISAVLLELAVWAVIALGREHERRERESATTEAATTGDQVIGGTLLAGVRQVARSPYLLGISAYLFFHSLTGTFLYFQQAHVIDAYAEDPAVRTQMFAWIDFGSQALTLVVQLFLTGRMIRSLGIGFTLLLLPAVVVVGFLTLGVSYTAVSLPLLVVLAGFQILRRGLNHATAKPARETLFTVVSREERYKAKTFMDTFVYRGADLIAAYLFDLLVLLTNSLAVIAFLAAPVGFAWMGVGWALGRSQRERAAAERAAT